MCFFRAFKLHQHCRNNHMYYLTMKTEWELIMPVVFDLRNGNVHSGTFI